VADVNSIFYETLGRDNMCLLWHLKEVLAGLPFRSLLDAGGGVRVSRNICLPEQVQSAAVIDPDAAMLGALAGDYNDPRIRTIAGSVGTAIQSDERADLVFFILSLPWSDDPAAALAAAASAAPAFIVVSNPDFSPEQLALLPAGVPSHGADIARMLERYYARRLDADALLGSRGYYPLVVYGSRSWSPTPEHTVRTVLYTTEKPDRVPYDNAKYIIQVNGKCTNNCPSCYVVKTDETMDTGIFNGIIENVRENEMICLRGGEPPLSENLIEDFILPSLARGIYVILESNGSFIGSSRYGEYLELLARKNIEVRLSLDREHYDFFPEHIQRTRIGWVSRFIEDATRRNIRFGLFTLGMCRAQVMAFLEGFGVESWIRHIRPLTRYSNISDLPIRGKYVDIKGAVHDSMSGDYIRQTFFSSYQEVVESGTDRISGDTLPLDLKDNA
jgi:hypothetical protein